MKKALLTKFTSALSWQWYRDFFALSYLRYMVGWFSIVPLMALVLGNIPETVQLTFTEPPTPLYIRLPFSWQILWAGSFCFFLAYLIYQFRVPTFVRRYHSLDDYKDKGHSPRWISWESKDVYEWDIDKAKFVDRLQKKGYLHTSLSGDIKSPEVVVIGPTTEFRFTHDGTHYVLSMPIVDDKGIEDEDATAIAVREIFWEIFGRYADSRLPERIVIKFLLVMAGLCVAIVVIEHIVNTLPYLFR